MSISREQAWEWSAFWKAENPDSCLPEGADLASGIARAWHSFFESLGPGSRILDLGTGNGSLASRAAAVGSTKQRPFTIEAVDLADIDPHRFLPAKRDILSDIRFRGRTAMESLPFGDGTFDAVVSQYGIEYSDLDRSIPEALRLLAPLGRLRLLLHAEDGVLAERCRLQSRQARDILDSTLFADVVDLLEKLHAAEQGGGGPQTHGQALSAVQVVKSTLDSLAERFGADTDASLPGAVFAAVRRLPDLRKSLVHGTLMATAAETRHLLEAQLQRLVAMQAAALDRQGMESLAARVGALGLRVRMQAAEADEGGRRLGWWLEGAA